MEPQISQISQSGSAAQKIFTVEEAAAYLRIGICTMYAHIRQGKLKVCRHGKGRGTIRINIEDLEVFRLELAAPDKRPSSAGTDTPAKHTTIPQRPDSTHPARQRGPVSGGIQSRMTAIPRG